MILPTLKLADDLALDYQREAEARNLTLVEVLQDRLARAGALDPRERVVILAGNPRQRLEAILGGLPVTSPEDLLIKVGRLAKIRFGDHELKLSAGQLEEIKHMAFKQSKTPERVLAEMWTRFCDEFFTRLPSKTA